MTRYKARFNYSPPGMVCSTGGTDDSETLYWDPQALEGIGLRADGYLLANYSLDNPVVKCVYCGQYATSKTECVHCGAPVE